MTATLWVGIVSVLLFLGLAAFKSGKSIFE